jgi:hypothetical protein
MKPRITNTTAEARRAGQSLGAFGLGAAVLGTSGSIEASEAKGQQELSGGAQLPVKMPNSARAELERRGVVFSKNYSNGDNLFFDVTLPTGWKIVPQKGSSYWSDLVDDKEKKVASIFYKAAFYDRDAFLNLSA